MFPILEWRLAVDHAARELGAEAIAPFGFELTESPVYLSSPLRYLFVYLSPEPDAWPKERVAHVFRRALGLHAPAVADSIQVIDVDRTVLTVDASGGRTLVVRSLSPPPRLSPRVWGQYVVAAAIGENRRRIKAVTDFEIDLMSQRYCCQLAIMHEALVSGLSGAPRLGPKREIVTRLRALQQVSLAERHRTELLEDDGRSLFAAIAAWYNALGGWLPAGGERISVPDFHGGHRLELPVNDTVERMVETAAARYVAYPLLAAPSPEPALG